jgi:surfactin synthase thioesterase subunit
VFASGTHAPSRRDPERYANLETDAALRAELEKLSGTPRSVLDNDELMQMTLPILRADFRAAADYRCTPESALAAPLHVFGGADDTTTPATLMAWREHTRAEFFLDVLPGGHFFIHQHEAALLELLEQRLGQVLGRASAHTGSELSTSEAARSEPGTSGSENSDATHTL